MNDSFDDVTSFSVGEQAGERKVLTIKDVEYPFRWCPAGTFYRWSISGLITGLITGLLVGVISGVMVGVFSGEMLAGVIVGVLVGVIVGVFGCNSGGVSAVLPLTHADFGKPPTVVYVFMLFGGIGGVIVAGMVHESLWPSTYSGRTIDDPGRLYHRESTRPIESMEGAGGNEWVPSLPSRDNQQGIDAEKVQKPSLDEILKGNIKIGGEDWQEWKRQQSVWEQEAIQKRQRQRPVFQWKKQQSVWEQEGRRTKGLVGMFVGMPVGMAIGMPVGYLVVVIVGWIVGGLTMLFGAKVTLSKGFWLLETVVTQEMWESVMGSNPSLFQGKRLPVEQVNWADCQEFITVLNNTSGAVPSGFKFSLPTEAQWEYACRAGEMGADEAVSNLGEMGWCKSNSGSKTHEAGQMKPNGWGLYDMHGNVREWCSDWFGNYPSGAITDPKGPSTGTHRVSRGGSWGSRARCCRSAYRRREVPSRRNDDLGLRLSLVSE